MNFHAARSPEAGIPRDDGLSEFELKIAPIDIATRSLPHAVRRHETPARSTSAIGVLMDGWMTCGELTARFGGLCPKHFGHRLKNLHSTAVPHQAVFFRGSEPPCSRSENLTGRFLSERHTQHSCDWGVGSFSSTAKILTLLEPHSHMWGQSTLIIRNLSPKRDWGPKRVNRAGFTICELQ